MSVEIQPGMGPQINAASLFKYCAALEPTLPPQDSQASVVFPLQKMDGQSYWLARTGNEGSTTYTFFGEDRHQDVTPPLSDGDSGPIVVLHSSNLVEDQVPPIALTPADLIGVMELSDGSSDATGELIVRYWTATAQAATQRVAEKRTRAAYRRYAVTITLGAVAGMSVGGGIAAVESNDAVAGYVAAAGYVGAMLG